MSDAILFEAKAFLTLMAYIRSINNEICGIGRLQKDQFGVPRITEIKILPQVVGAADANVTAEDMEKFFETVSDDEKSEWCFNFHTHPKFSTNPSNVDLRNYKNMSDLFDVFVPMIFQHSGQYNAYIYNSYPVKTVNEIKNIWIYEWRNKLKLGREKLDKDSQVSLIESIMDMVNMKLSEEESFYIQTQVSQNVQENSYTINRYNGYDYGYGYAYSQTTHKDMYPKNNYQYGLYPEAKDNKIIVPEGYPKKTYTQTLYETDYDFQDSETEIKYDQESWANMEWADSPKGYLASYEKEILKADAHNWSLEELKDAMLDYDFEWHKKQKSFIGIDQDGNKITFSIPEAINFIKTVI